MLIEIKVKIELSIIRLDTLLVRLKQTMDVHSESRSQNIVLQNCHFWTAKRTVLECKTHRFGTAFVSFSFTISYEGQFSEDFSPVLAP